MHHKCYRSYHKQRLLHVILQGELFWILSKWWCFLLTVDQLCSKYTCAFWKRSLQSVTNNEWCTLIAKNIGMYNQRWLQLRSREIACAISGINFNTIIVTFTLMLFVQLTIGSETTQQVCQLCTSVSARSLLADGQRDRQMDRRRTVASPRSA